MAIFLIDLVLSRSLSAYFDVIKPSWALVLRSTDANAKLQIVNDAIVANPRVVPDASKLRNFLVDALQSEPFNPRAFELMGVLYAASDGAKADLYMRAAVERSQRRPVALLWTINRMAAAGNISDSIGFADALLRVHPALMPLVAPTLLQLAKTDRGCAQIIRVLESAPSWRKAFFRFVNANIPADGIALKIMIGLASSPHPPSEQENSSYLWALIAAKKINLAYYAWLQFLQPEKAKAAGLLFNGNFAFAPAQAPFDWSMRGSSGSVIGIGHDAEQPDRNVLSIEFDGGRVNFHPITQLLMLPPGKYKFSGIVKGELNGARGLKWQFACVGETSKIIAETPMILGTMPEWADVSAYFEVPAVCTAQALRLILDARTSSETMLSGAVSFADLKIDKD